MRGDLVEDALQTSFVQVDVIAEGLLLAACHLGIEASHECSIVGRGKLPDGFLELRQRLSIAFVGDGLPEGRMVRRDRDDGLDTFATKMIQQFSKRYLVL